MGNYRYQFCKSLWTWNCIKVSYQKTHAQKHVHGQCLHTPHQLPHRGSDTLVGFLKESRFWGWMDGLPVTTTPGAAVAVIEIPVDWTRANLSAMAGVGDAG